MGADRAGVYIPPLFHKPSVKSLYILYHMPNPPEAPNLYNTRRQPPRLDPPYLA
ncbi:hypothetical protein apy_13760, partial [Aeropyrum pernix]